MFCGAKMTDLADGFCHLIAALHLDEEAVQPLRRNVGGDVGREHALARLLDGLLIQIGGEDLQGDVFGRFEFFQRLFEEDRQGIGFLAGGTGGYPRPQRLIRSAPSQQRRQDFGFQLLPRFRVAEKTRHPDQQLAEQQFHLLRILLQEAHIVGDLINLVQSHAPLDAAIDRGLFVQRKVVARLPAQQDHHFFKGALGCVFVGASGFGDERHMLEIGADLARQCLHRGDHIGQSGVNGAARHAVEFGGGRFLHKDHARFFLDGAQAQRAVRAHARKDHADAVFLLVIGQRAEEEINRQAQTARRKRIKQMEHAVQDGHILVGRDDIHAVRFDPHPILDLKNLHACAALEQFHHDALVRRVEVLDDDKRHAAVFGHVSEEQFQRLQSACRSADADDGETRSLFLFFCFNLLCIFQL